MDAIGLNKENINCAEHKTCKYEGVTYFVLTDMDGKCFIEVNGDRRYLDCHGNVIHKKKGSKSIKTAIENFEDMKKIQDYFMAHSQWNFYLLFTLNANTARRISDLLQTKWSDFFFRNGNMKKVWSLTEMKTKKGKEIYINAAIQEAFKIFLENEHSIDFEYDYNEPIFKQLHGTHRGKIVSQEGYRQALIKAGECLDYEIRSHSMRRGMGKMMLELHPNDPKGKSIIMELLNHSSEKMTNRYIGEIDKLQKKYVEDFGEKYVKYVMHGEDIPFAVKRPVSTYDNSELRQYMLCAFGKVLDVKDETDPVKLMALYNDLLDGLEDIAKKE